MGLVHESNSIVVLQIRWYGRALKKRVFPFGPLTPVQDEMDCSFSSWRGEGRRLTRPGYGVRGGDPFCGITPQAQTQVSARTLMAENDTKNTVPKTPGTNTYAVHPGEHMGSRLRAPEKGVFEF